MKVLSSTVVAVTALACSDAFSTKGLTYRSQQTTSLNLQIEDSIKSRVGAAVAGFAIASQVALVASPALAAPTPIVTSQETSLSHQVEAHIASAISTSNLQLAGNSFETLDFSMPSYDGSSAKPKEIPGFSNPFSSGSGSESSSAPKVDLDLPSFSNPFGSMLGGDDGSDDASKQAAAEAKQAASDAKKAEKEAAEAQKKAEKESAEAQKKAEKEARKKAELEKQRAMVERAKAAKEAEAEAAASAPAPAPVVEESAPAETFKAPDLNVEIPDIKLPEISLPKFSMPSMEMPKMDMPKMDMPKVDMPKVDAPAFKAPDVAEFKAPEFKAPDVKIPEFKAPEVSLPEFKAPEIKVPSFSMPEMPKVAAPAPKVDYSSDFSSSFSSDFSSAPVEDIEPQEVRDERAKVARSDFKAADNEAKEAEATARQLRDIANGKRKVANQLKDEACATRLGGKWICIRPFNSGY